MKNRTTIALLVLFFGGLLALWLAELARVPTPEELRRRAGRVLPELLDVPPSEVGRVEISGGEAPLSFRREGEGWSLVEPPDAPADPSRVDALIEALRALPRPANARPLEGPPKEYGLDPPVRTIRLYKDGASQPLATLEVGKALGSGRYVRAAGRPDVEVVDALPLATVDQPLADWRDHAVFRLPGFKVDELEIVGDGRTIQARREGDRWQLLRPIRAPGDTPRIESLLGGLTSLRIAPGAEGFVAESVEDFEKYGLDEPAWRVTLRSLAGGEGRDDVLLVGDPVPDHSGRFYARRGGSDGVIAIEGRGLARLGEDAHVLRSRRVAVIDPSRVTRIRVESGGVVHEILRDGREWTLGEPSRAPADPALVHALLGELNALEAFDLLDPEAAPEPGLARPSAVVSVWEEDESGEPDVRLTLGRRNGAARTLYARAEGDPAVLALPIDALDEDFRDPLAFIEHQVVTQPSPSRGLTLRREGRTFRLLAPPASPRDYASWKLAEPVRAAVDPEAVGLLDAVAGNVRAERVVEVGTPDRARFGLDEPWAVLSQQTAPGVEAAPPLVVGDPVPDGGGSRYAMVEGRDLVFTLPPATVAILGSELHRRRVFEFGPEQVERLVLARPGRVQGFRHASRPFTGGLEWVPERGTDVADVAVADLDLLAGALGRFLTPRFVQYEGPFPPEACLETPVLGLTLELSGGLGRRFLRVGAESDEGNRYATAEEGTTGAVFLLPTDRDLPWAPLLPGAPETPGGAPGRAELPADPFAGEPDGP
jgi:hypothetical protein